MSLISDLFFADAAILVEGCVERLLLPLMVEKDTPQLKSSYLSILELGGAFAHRFRELIHFLGLTTLVITDLDSILPPSLEASKADAGTPTSSEESRPNTGGDEQEAVDVCPSGVCKADTPNAVTSNQTLIKWLPQLNKVSELLQASANEKMNTPTILEPARVRIAYQMPCPATWNGETALMAGRTFEEAFAYQNLTWCQDINRRSLGLYVVPKDKSLRLSDVAQRIHNRVRGSSFKKTDFALALMMEDISAWGVPSYISEGLRWLNEQLTTCPVASTLAANPMKMEAAE